MWPRRPSAAAAGTRAAWWHVRGRGDTPQRRQCGGVGARRSMGCVRCGPAGGGTGLGPEHVGVRSSRFRETAPPSWGRGAGRPREGGGTPKFPAGASPQGVLMQELYCPLFVSRRSLSSHRRLGISVAGQLRPRSSAGRPVLCHPGFSVTPTFNSAACVHAAELDTSSMSFPSRISSSFRARGAEQAAPGRVRTRRLRVSTREPSP